jgi:hypothetical protein
MRLYYLPSVFLLSLLLGSCKDTSTSYSVGTGNGNIYGYIYLLDSNGNDISPRDFSNFLISIPGGSQSTSTTVDGQYELQGVPTSGSFTLVFSKPGFAEHRDIGHIFRASVPGSLIEDYNTVIMYRIRQLTPDLVLRPFQSLNGADSPHTVAIFTCRIMDSLGKNQYGGYIKLFFSKTSSIVASDPQSYQYTLPLTGIDAESGISTVGIFRDSLLNNGFSQSDTIYCIAYYTGFYTKNEFYIDNATDKRIYTGLSPFHSEVRSFILP